MKILCIEDDFETAKLIAEELTEQGFDVIIAHDGHEGLIAILKGIPDLVLCDIGLPRISGFDVLSRLKALAPQMKCVPFIFLTALTDRDNKRRAMSLGADHYVTKPINFEILGTIVKSRLAETESNQLLWKRIMLNDEEAEALTWVACGKTTDEIASLLGLTEQVIDTRLDNAWTKINATA